MAGLAGTFSYALMTDVNLLALTPKNAMLVMLIVPISFMFSRKTTKAELWPSTEVEDTVTKDPSSKARNMSLDEKLEITKIELVVFDCLHGFRTSSSSQYRWYQVFYQIGVFISRSSVNLVRLNFICISLTAVIQTAFTIMIFLTAIYSFIPHFAIVAGTIFLVGIVGGVNYANTFYHIHRKVDPGTREFALSMVTFADTVGILGAAIVAIPVHNWICAIQ
ncbi:hypothetical protein KIN20_018092 [Parelaphostrongylus tenuis]|uniref:Battenin n=1 Tax=Parelaphostrongylus tenuis TaxID=148309 RepID=A0AAD5QR92_PARTN|nr:hypothetical protein KIN20_018092 [Parelaphostrongylus tenuis]